MIQATVRAWPASAVHDTVAAVVRSAAFRRSVRTTMLERLFGWLGQGFQWLARALAGVPGGRNAVIWITSLVVLLIVARLLLAAQARDPHARVRVGRRGAVRNDDPWREAERLTAAGDHEAAAHALYRGVLASVARNERLRLDASKTSGDYARELRMRGSATHQPFRAFARRFDAAIYGRTQIDGALIAELLQLAAPLRAGARAA